MASVLTRVVDGGRVIVTRHGRPVAVVLGVEDAMELILTSWRSSCACGSRLVSTFEIRVSPAAVAQLEELEAAPGDARGEAERCGGVGRPRGVRRAAYPVHTPMDAAACKVVRQASWSSMRWSRRRELFAGCGDRSSPRAADARSSGSPTAGGRWAALELYPDGLGLEVGVEVGVALLAADAG